jgi:hypothetical protein
MGAKGFGAGILTLFESIEESRHCEERYKNRFFLCEK